MRDVFFWTGIYLMFWGPGFTLTYMGNEKDLATAIRRHQASLVWAERWFGHFFYVFCDQLSRWLVSATGLVLLFVLKLAGG